jgi:hypothetical protein
MNVEKLKVFSLIDLNSNKIFNLNEPWTINDKKLIKKTYVLLTKCLSSKDYTRKNAQRLISMMAYLSSKDLAIWIKSAANNKDPRVLDNVAYLLQLTSGNNYSSIVKERIDIVNCMILIPHIFETKKIKSINAVLKRMSGDKYVI